MHVFFHEVLNPTTYALKLLISPVQTGPRSAVGNVSGCRYVSDCRSRGRELDPGPVHTFVEIDHEIKSTAILVPSADPRRVTSQSMVNCLVKLVQGKSVVSRTDRPDVTIAVNWDVKNQAKPKLAIFILMGFPKHANRISRLYVKSGQFVF